MLPVGYKPIKTELQGVGYIATGFVFVGAATCYKVKEYFVGVKPLTVEVPMSESMLFAKSSSFYFYEGCKQLLPAATVSFLVYCIGHQILNGENNENHS